MLREFLNESQSVSDLRHKWWVTLTYPLILAGLAMLVMTALSIFVIPEFNEIFREFALPLPKLTEFIVDVADVLTNWGVVFLAVVSALLLFILLYSNRLLPVAVAQWLRDWIRPPFSRRTMIARFARFLADLLEAGVSIPDALRIAGFTIEPKHARRAAWQLARDLEGTGGFSQNKYRRPLSSLVAFALTPEMPPDSRIRLLREASSCHAERVRVGLSWATGFIEPLAIMLVGFVVGCVVLGLFLPLVRLVEGLSM
jgi:type IV pilus assembly protein PilC